jgi:hypothetical protein
MTMLRATWDKLKAACFRSLTIAWSYVLGALGALMQSIDSLAALFGDDSFSAQVKTLIGTDPKLLGKWLSITALVTIVSRLRGVFARKS